MSKQQPPKSQTSEHLKMKNSVRPKIVLEIAFKNLMAKKLRTSLTILGVIIGIGATFFLISFGLGLRNLVAEDIAGSESVKSIDVSAINSNIVKLDDDNVNRFREFGHVDDVGVAYTMAASANFKEAETDTVIYSVDQTYYNLGDLAILEGAPLDLDGNTADAVVNKAFLEAIGVENEEEIVGQKINLLLSAAASKLLDKDHMLELNIKGVYDSGSGAEVFFSEDAVEGFGLDQYNEVKVVADNTESVTQIRQQIESAGFRTQSPLDTLNEIDRAFAIFNFILVGFGSIGMIIAVLGMFNTLVISLLERTQEVGLMMALGSRRKDIKRMFIIEAWLLAFIGGLIGVIGSVIFAFILNIIANQTASSRGVQETFSLFSFPLYVILGTLVFATVVGIVVALAPAKRASNINPIDALRNE